MLFFSFVLLVAYLLARVEIEIEGAGGYAKNLPVKWRATNKWVKNFIGGTSYHLYMWSLLLALIHLPFIIGLAWSLEKEMLVISFLLFITVLEDFLWFVLNPAFGIKKFRRECIPWFQDRWFLFCPSWYFYYLPAGIGLYVGSKIIGG